LLDLVKVFKRYNQKCALASFFGPHGIRVLFYVALPIVQSTVKLNKSYIRQFSIHCRLCVPKIIRFGQSIWKIQAKMCVGLSFFGPHGRCCTHTV